MIMIAASRNSRAWSAEKLKCVINSLSMGSSTGIFNFGGRAAKIKVRRGSSTLDESKRWV